MKPEFSAMGPSRPPGSDQRGADQGPADDWDEEDFGPGASLTSPIPDKPQPASLGMLALGLRASRYGGGRNP
jgi:hypothetical protein